MANIKNFGLVGVGSDVQFGKSGPRLINETGIFKFKKADGVTAEQAVFANITAEELAGKAGQIVSVDATGKLVMGVAIDTLAVKTDVDAAIEAEKDRAEAAELALTEAAAAEKLLRVAAEAAIAAAVVTEKERAEAAELALQRAIADLGTAVTGELQEALDAEVLRATEEDERIAGLVAAEKSRAIAAEEALAAAAVAETAVRVAAEKVIADALAAEVTRATDAEANLRADMSAEDAAIRAEMQAAIAGITWENPVNQMVATVAVMQAMTLAEGARVYVTAENKVFTVTKAGVAASEGVEAVAAEFDAGELMVQGAAFFDRATTVPYVFNGTDMVQFNGAAGLSAGLGLVMNGNTMDLDLASTGGLKFYPDALNPNNTVGLKLADLSLEVGTDGLKLSAALQAEIAKLRTDLTAEATAARAAELTLTTDLATEVGLARAAEAALATRMTAVEGKNTAQDVRLDDLEAKTGADSALLQAEVDFMEAALGLGEDGSLQLWANGNYFVAGVAAADGVEAVAPDSFKSAIEKIDAALKAMDVAYKAADVVVLANAKEYANSLDAAMLQYVGGQIVLVTEAIATAKAEAIAAAALDATAKANKALADSKIYTDSKISDQIGAANAARAVYAAFDGVDAVIGMVKGFVHRIKVYMTAAGATDSLVQVGTGGQGGVNGLLASTADVDSSVAGLYTVEVNEVFTEETAVTVFVGGAAAGKVVVEYLA